MKRIISFKNSSIIVGISIFVWWTFFCNFQDNRAYNDPSYKREHYHQDTSKVYFDLGVAAQKRKDYGSALKAYSAALEHRPEMLEVYDNMGKVYEHIGKKNDALKTYFHGTHIHPHFNQVRFMTGKQLPEHILPCKDAIQDIPKWAGEPLQNKTIFVYAENGLGDTLNFVRFLDGLVSRGAKVIFKPQNLLVSYLKQCLTKVRVLDKQEAVPTAQLDYHCSLLSLPHLFGTTVETIPHAQGYLTANQDMVTLFKEKLFNNNKVKVGIVWQGDPNLLNDENRSTKLHYFYQLGRIPNVQLYSIQKFFDLDALKQTPADISIINLDPYIKTFDDTAALIANLDLVISIDSVVAHLTGGLGKPVWMLTPYVTDWRWLGYSEQETSAWYKSMTKLRQPAPKEWNHVFALAQDKLKQLAKKVSN